MRARWLLVAVAVAAYATAVHYLVGWPPLIDAWGLLPPAGIAVCVALMLGSYAARALRVYLNFAAGRPRGFAHCVHITLLHNAVNNLLPMRSGELSFPLLMKRVFATPYAASASALLVYRALDLHTLLALGLLAWAWGEPLRLLGWCAWLALPALVWQMARSRRHRARVSSTARWPRAAAAWRDAVAGLPAGGAVFAGVWASGTLNWLLKLGALGWVLSQLTAIDLARGVLGALGGELTAVLPVNTPGGLGTYEAGNLAVLSLLGVDGGAALAAAVSAHLLLLALALLSGALALARWPAPAGGRAPR